MLHCVLQFRHLKRPQRSTLGASALSWCFWGAITPLSSVHDMWSKSQFDDSSV